LFLVAPPSATAFAPILIAVVEATLRPASIVDAVRPAIRTRQNDLPPAFPVHGRVRRNRKFLDGAMPDFHLPLLYSP